MTESISRERTKNYLKQLKGSFVFKLLAMLASFLLIPIMIHYLGSEQYGVWSTLLSIVSWIVLFDLGIGNGLRNKVTESLAKDNILDAQKYISTSYVLIGGITLFILIIFLLISNFIPWQDIFNTKILSTSELKNIVNITLGIILLNFWLSLINQVLNGLQRSAINVINQFISSLLSLILIFLLSKFSETSLISLALLYGFSLIISNLVISIWFYKNNKNLMPKIMLFNKKFVRSITSLGANFFIIQIAVIMLFTTDKILITQLFGPAYVAEYDVVFKLFSAMIIAHGVIIAPLWSAYSDAFHRNDFLWIKQMLKKQLKIYMGFIVVTLLLIVSSPIIIHLWIGKDFELNNFLVIVIGIFSLISIWSNIFSHLLNGMGKMKIQLFTSLIALMVNIPLSIMMVKLVNMRIDGIVIGTIISLSLFAIAGPIQTYYILKEKN